MKVLKVQTAVCTSIQMIGTIGHAVHFHETVDDYHRNQKSTWAFVIPGLSIKFELGKQYAIQVCDPAEKADS